MFRRGFSNRERALVLVLALLLAGGLYFLGVWAPTSEAISQARLEAIDYEILLNTEQNKSWELQSMREKLEEIGYGERALAMTPTYDNVSNVVPLLNSALETSLDYDLRFSPVQIENNFATREVQMTFTASNYRSAKAIISELAVGPYSCDIGTLRVETVDPEATGITSGNVKVSLTILYYEIYIEFTGE